MSGLTGVERALQSQSLNEQLCTIAQCASAIRQNPFPLFVNALLVRLADVFNGEKLTKIDCNLNLIRLRIVKLLKECGTDLTFANDEMIRRAMKVSHSNDYKSRALTMLFFAAAAPIVHHNKKVHHLLVEGLDCNELTELTSAIVSAGHLGRFSSEFSSLIVDKISEMVCETQTEESLKVRLMDDLSFFKENMAVTKKCMDLGRFLLRNNPNQRVSLVVINALTELAKRNGLAVSDQIDLLLTEIDQFTKSRRFLHSFLANLLRLAVSPQHWLPEHVIKLRGILPILLKAKFNDCLELWLECMTLVGSHIYRNEVIDTVPFIIPLLNEADIQVRTKAMALLIMLARNSAPNTIDDLLNVLGLSLLQTLQYFTTPECDSTDIQRADFIRMVLKLIENGEIESYGINTWAVIEVLQEADETHGERPYIQALEALNAIADFQPNVAIELSRWALHRIHMYESNLIYRLPDPLFCLALLPIKSNREEIYSLVEKVSDIVKENSHLGWFAYKMARRGFRFGHWSDVALSLLELIQERCHSVDCSAFISALTHIAGSQLPINVDVQSLKISRQSLRHALLLLQPMGKSSRHMLFFNFPINFVSALGFLFEAINVVLVAINCDMESNPMAVGRAHMDYMMISIKEAHKEFRAIRNTWLDLHQRSFDADENTQHYLELLSRHSHLIELMLGRLNTPDVVPIPMFPRIALNSTNKQLESLLEWAHGRINESFRPVTGTTQERMASWASNLKTFSTLFHSMAAPPFILPRYFFQQIWHTNIKLNVMPQPSERDSFIQLQTNQLPLTIEGFIESNNPTRIESVEIRAYLKVESSEEPKLADVRKAQLRPGDQYFKEHFLLTIHKLTEIHLVIFITDDSENKRTWLAHQQARVLVNVPEVKTDQ